MKVDETFLNFSSSLNVLISMNTLSSIFEASEYSSHPSTELQLKKSTQLGDYIPLKERLKRCINDTHVKKAIH